MKHPPDHLPTHRESPVSGGGEPEIDRTDGSRPISLDLIIETPENVVLTYRLAGPTARCGAVLIDYIIRSFLIFVVAMILGAFSAIALSYVAGGLLVLFVFLMNWGYFAVSEGFFQGRTIGKWALGLRVVQERGHPITFWSALTRNLFRTLDSIPLYGIGFVSMLLNKRFQRLGDLVARTVVITERRVILPREPVILERIEPLPREQLGSYVPDQRTLSLIDQFLGRRSVLSHERGHDLAAILAGRLAKRLRYRGDLDLVKQFPMAFLARVYVTFLRDEDEWRPSRTPQPETAGVVR